MPYDTPRQPVRGNAAPPELTHRSRTRGSARNKHRAGECRETHQGSAEGFRRSMRSDGLQTSDAIRATCASGSMAQTRKGVPNAITVAAGWRIRPPHGRGCWQCVSVPPPCPIAVRHLSAGGIHDAVTHLRVTRPLQDSAQARRYVPRHYRSQRAPPQAV